MKERTIEDTFRVVEDNEEMDAYRSMQEHAEKMFLEHGADAPMMVGVCTSIVADLILETSDPELTLESFKKMMDLSVGHRIKRRTIQ